MKQLCRLRVTDKTYDFQDTLSLLATSHIFGLVFVGTPDKVLVIKVADIVQIDNSTSKKTEISTYPFKAIQLPSSPCFVGLSSDNLTLMVCLQKSGCPVGWMYDVRGFARQVRHLKLLTRKCNKPFVLDWALESFPRSQVVIY